MDLLININDKINLLLKDLQFHCKCKTSRKVAILMSGHLRNFEEHIDNFKEYLYDIICAYCDCTVFFCILGMLIHPACSKLTLYNPY